MRLLVLIFVALLAGRAEAYPIVLKRGLPTDIWLTWPDGSRLDEPGLIQTFPEYRQSFDGHEFALAKAAGFDFIRLTIDPAIFLYKARPEKTAMLLSGTKAAIAEILAAGLKVDVDLHIIPRNGDDPGTDQMLADDAAFERYLALVSEVGKLVARFPADQVAFEPMNEPTVDCDAIWNGARQRWPAMLERLHAAARAAAPHTTLVLSGACWGGADGLAQIDPETLQDENIIWSFHSYEPFVFSHQGASWSDDAVAYVSGLSFPPVKGTKQKVLKRAENRIALAKLPKARQSELRTELRDYLERYYQPGGAADLARAPFAKVAAWAVKYHIRPQRILLGEFGAIRSDKFAPLSDAARAPLITLIRSEAEVHGYAWSCWSWTGSFGISRPPDSRDFSPVLAKALGLQAN